MKKNLIIFAVTTLFAICESFTCRNEQNEPVDWFVLYKIPTIKTHENDLIKTGLSYTYMTSEDVQTGWKLSERSINDTNSIPGFTLKPLYENQTLMHILYNDEPPVGKVSFDLGHTKGVLMSNDSHGIWLIHSVPHYPPSPENSYSYPKSGAVFGQSFLCVSFALNALEKIGKQLQYNQPYIYHTFMDNGLRTKLPNLNKALNNYTVISEPWFHLTTLKSNGNVTFLSFAKHGKFGKDLYGDWISVALESDLFVESWLNGAGRLPSNCTNEYKVNNIKMVQLPSNVQFKSSRDHSKWSVTNSNTNEMNWTCIGDINRQEHQKLRGGGVLCLFNPIVCQQYHQSVIDIEKCKN